MIGALTFIDAVKQGDLETVNNWLAAGVDVAADNYAALRWAVHNDHLAVVKRLLQIETVRNNAANDDNLALHWAIQKGYLDITEQLLQIESVRNHAAIDDNSVLRRAATYGRLEVVELLLKIDEVANNAAALRNDALCLAAENGHLTVVKRLLKIETVRNNAATDKNCALRLAALNGHLAVVKRLLKIETVRNNAAVSRNRALRWAADNEQTDVIEELLEIDSVRNHADTPEWLLHPLLEAIRTSNFEAIKEHVDDPTIDSEIFSYAFNLGYYLYNKISHPYILEQLIYLHRKSGSIGRIHPIELVYPLLESIRLRDDNNVSSLLKYENERANAGNLNNYALKLAILQNNSHLVTSLLEIDSVRSNLKSIVDFLLAISPKYGSNDELQYSYLSNVDRSEVFLAIYDSYKPQYEAFCDDLSNLVFDQTRSLIISDISSNNSILNRTSELSDKNQHLFEMMSYLDGLLKDRTDNKPTVISSSHDGQKEHDEQPSAKRVHTSSSLLDQCDLSVLDPFLPPAFLIGTSQLPSTSRSLPASDKGEPSCSSDGTPYSAKRQRL